MEWDEDESTWYVGMLHRPRMMADECGAIGGMIGTGNGSAQRNVAPMLLFFQNKYNTRMPPSGM
jgi:hypothetical protein